MVFEAHPRDHQLTWWHAAALALRGDSALAVNALRHAIALGHLGNWRFMVALPHFGSLAREPAFQQLVSDLENEMTRQRERLRALREQNLSVFELIDLLYSPDGNQLAARIRQEGE